MKLLVESVHTDKLNLDEERLGFEGIFVSRIGLSGSITFNFQSSGGFCQFLKSNGKLKRKKLEQAIAIAILNQSIEL